MGKLSIYLNIRPNSRERMWKTVRRASGFFRVALPKVSQNSSISTYKKLQSSWIAKIKMFLINYGFLLNKQTLGNTEDAKFLYMWGAFPKNNDKDIPHIIELDNPYVLTYYNRRTFNLRKNTIKQNLRKAKAITCMSMACRYHALHLLGREFENKTSVIYPYVDKNYTKVDRKDDGITRFLFVGTDYKIKGGRELLKVFHSIKDKNIELTFISFVDEKLKNKYKDDSRIIFLEPQEHKVLMEEIYPKMDILAFPTLYESFGVVLLEALSFGMGLIATNLYATPELVSDAKNGKLLKHPFFEEQEIFGKQMLSCTDIRISELHNKYLDKYKYDKDFCNSIKNAIIEGSKNKDKWQTASVKLFEQKFSPDIWDQNFKKLFIEK